MNYFANSNTSTIFRSGDPLTFRVQYSDAGDYPPTYHDGVQGYVDMVIDDSGVKSPMGALSPPITDYTQPDWFTTTLTDVADGVHEYHYEGNDGYFTTDFPTGPTTNPEANDYMLTINRKPTISEATVSPTTGQSATQFAFSCYYADADWSTTGKPTPQVVVRLVRIDGTPAEFPYVMTAVGSSPNYATGAQFTATVSGLTTGHYNVTFEASDGLNKVWQTMPTPILVRSYNHPPQLTLQSVVPPIGKSNAQFLYTVYYTDSDGDPPQVVSGGQVVPDIVLLVDYNTTTKVAKQQVLMTAVTSGGQIDYTQPVMFQATLSGLQLGNGTHNYTAAATDGIDSAAVPTPLSGPTLAVPYFNNFRFVPASAPTDSVGITTADLGDEVLVAGSLKFPYSPSATRPDQVSNIVVTITKPDGTTLSLAANANGGGGVDLDSSGNIIDWVDSIVVTYSGSTDPSLATGNDLTLTSSGPWNASASWGGNTSWDAASTTQNAQVTVGGPMRTVAVSNGTDPTSTPVVDMITPPMEIGSSDPGAIFGYTRASLLRPIRWEPTSGAYFQYGVTGSNFTLNPGEAVWIKPLTSYPYDTIYQTDANSGLLAFGNPGSAVNYANQYRLVEVYAGDYPTDSNGNLLPCTISLKQGWNQFGNIFHNWQKDSAGNIITPRVDVGLPISEAQVQVLGVTKTLADANTANWISNYAWRYDVTQNQYVLVHPTRAGAERVLTAWYGYWIWADQDCQLIINPQTTYNGSSTGGTATIQSESVQSDDLLKPPPLPK